MGEEKDLGVCVCAVNTKINVQYLHCPTLATCATQRGHIPPGMKLLPSIEYAGDFF